MKKIATLIIVLLLSSPLYAQHHQSGQKPQQPKIEDIVSNLSAKQKRQLEAIEEDQREELNALKKELQVVRDSVHYYMDLYGDYTAQVNRLMEREASLQLQVNKLLYETKVMIDKVLTPAQYKEMKSKMKQHKSPGKNAGKK